MTAINAERGFKKLVTIGEGFKDVLEAAEEINRIGGLSRAAKAMEASADDARQRQTIAEQKLKAVEEDVKDKIGGEITKGLGKLLGGN